MTAIQKRILTACTALFVWLFILAFTFMGVDIKTVDPFVRWLAGVVVAGSTLMLAMVPEFKDDMED